MMPRHWLNLIGDPNVAARVSESIRSVAERTELRTTSADLMLSTPSVNAVVIDHNTAKAWLLIAGAMREAGRLVVYVGRESGKTDSLNHAAGLLGCFRVNDYTQFDSYFGIDGRWRQSPDAVRFGDPEGELAELESIP